MTEQEPQTIRERVYEIRRVLGPDRRTPLSQGEFAKRANAIAGRYGQRANYDASVISKIENGLRTVTIEEVPIFAALDPKQRGEVWLAWGGLPGKPLLDLDPARDHRLTEEELERARKQVAEKAAASRPATSRKAGKRRP